MRGFLRYEFGTVVDCRLHIRFDELTLWTHSQQRNGQEVRLTLHVAQIPTAKLQGFQASFFLSSSTIESTT